MDMMKIRVDLETVTAVQSSSRVSLEENLQKSLVRHRDDLAEVLKHLYQQVDQRIGTVEELLEAQATRIEASQLNQLGNSYGHRARYPKPLLPSRQQTQHQDFRNSKDYQTCKFLFNAGANADYRPLAGSDNSPRNKAHRFLLIGGLSYNDVEALRCLTQGDDFIEGQNYSHAADRNYVTCVRLLLEAGADPDIATVHNHKVSNPLNRAARNASDPLVLKTLLDFGADIESSGVDGMTALIHTARRDNAAFATLLLEYGAKISATSKSGQTPLTATIIYNSHNVLKLLLDRWFEYRECPRLTGPNLLQIVAIYADVETITILANADHLHLTYDSSYALGDFRSRLRQRTDASEKLILAFEELMEIVEQGPSRRQVYNDEESGLGQSCTSDSDSDTFENALESFDLTKKSFKTFDRPTICRLKSRTF
ncbi:MAG: hypothetical protein Q9167_001172 [Letrouitia subvulpina]